MKNNRLIIILSFTLILFSVGQVVATAPTFVQNVSVPWGDTSTPKTTSNFNVTAGDIIIAYAVSEDINYPITSPPVGTLSITWTLNQSYAVSGYTPVNIWSGVVGSTQNNVNVQFAAGAFGDWGAGVFTFRNSDGVGISNKSQASSGNPSLILTGVGTNSSIVMIDGDWNAIVGTRTYVTSQAGSFSEKDDYAGGINYGVHGGYYPDAGATGSKTVGMSAPTGQTWSLLAIEVKGTAGGTDTTAPTYSGATTNHTIAGMPVKFSITYNDETALHSNGQITFSTNNTGSWQNTTVNFSSTPSTVETITTLNSTVGITIGYRWYAKDNAGNWNNTSLYTLTTTTDSTPPVYSGAANNQSMIETSTNFSVNYTDNFALHSNGQYMFSTNNSGTWSNSSWTNFTATPQIIYNVTTLNSTIGLNIGYRWYAKDNAGNWNNTSIYTLTTTAELIANLNVYNVGWQAILANGTMTLGDAGSLLGATWIVKRNTTSQKFEAHKPGWNYHTSLSLNKGDGLYTRFSTNKTITLILNDSYNWTLLPGYNLVGIEQDKTLSQINASVNTACEVDKIEYVNLSTQIGYTYTCGSSGNATINIHAGEGIWMNSTVSKNIVRVWS